MTLARFLPLVVLIPLATACSRDPGKLKQEYLASGDAYAAAREYDAAIIEYRNAIQQDPQFGQARYRLATAYIRTNDAPRALYESVRAADLLPHDVDVQLQAANLLLVAGRFGDARDRADRVLQAEPNNVRGQLALGNALAGLADLDGAIAQIEEALRLDPSRVGTYSNLASLHAAAGRLEQAEALFKETVAKHPDSVSARLTLAHFYWVAERTDEAEPLVEQALAMAPPGDVEANRFAATFYQTIGQLAKAEQYLKVAVDNEGTSEARLALANYYLAISRTGDATPILQALAPDPRVGRTARTLLAAIDYSAGRADAAAQALDELLKEEPRNVQALIVRASILFDQRRLDEALERVDAAVATDSGSAQAQFARGRVLAARRQPEEAKAAFNETLRLNPRAAGAQVELAKLHLEAGATDTSVSLAGAAVKTDPLRPDARLVLARGLMARRDFIQAEAILKQLRTAMPNAAVIPAQMGLLYGLKGARAEAAAEFERALQLDPLQLEAVSGLIGLDLLARREASAHARIEALVARAPTHAGVLALAGRVYLVTGVFDAAEQMLTRAIEADASRLDAYGMLGQVYLGQDRLDDARLEFARLAERQPRPVSALTMVGMIFGMQKRTEEAKQVFERVMQIDPRAAVAANNLAWIYAEHGGNLDVALQLAQTAKAALPDEGPVNDTLGWVLLKKDLVPLAIASLRQAVDQIPSKAGYHYHLGLAYARSGDTERARQALSTALKLDPKFEGAPDASRVLGTL